MNCFKCKCVRSFSENDAPVISKNRAEATSGDEKPAGGDMAFKGMMRKLSNLPLSEPAIEASMGEMVDMMQFLRGEEMMTFNAFLQGEDFVTVRQFLKEEEDEDPAWNAREKIPPPMLKCITLSDLPESPSRTRRVGIVKRATISDLSLPISTDKKDTVRGPHIIKQSSAPLLKYLPGPPTVDDEQDTAAAASGTIPPPPSPQNKRKKFDKGGAQKAAK